MTVITDAFFDATGLCREDVIGMTRRQVLEQHFGNLGSAGTEGTEAHLAAVDRREAFRDLVVEFPHADGSTLYFLSHGQPIHDENGVFQGYRGTAIDITAQRESEALLRQSQKMEVVGQLTGGIAHDFNNLLGVVIGNLDFLAERLTGDEELLEYVESATDASLHGADLIHQLLAFSRKQPLSPKTLDLDERVSGMLKMLRRTLGATIEIETIRSDGPLTAEIDPTQLESAVLNLAVNARDAMPAGGRLTIEMTKTRLDEAYVLGQSEAAPGDYVMLSVTDTGTGMSPEVLAQVFEPFFTTKDVGEGSGLGLSMVFGFTKQSGGHVEIESTIGEGTTVKLFLPHTRRKIETPEPEPETIPMARGETVLVVEDDPKLLILAGALLKDLGYNVLEATDGDSALAALEDEDGIDLLLTDVVMPGGVSGPDLTAAVAARYPDIKVMYMSGYTKDELGDRFDHDDGVPVLWKPFRKPDLARMLRSVLDA